MCCSIFKTLLLSVSGFLFAIFSFNIHYLGSFERLFTDGNIMILCIIEFFFCTDFLDVSRSVLCYNTHADNYHIPVTDAFKIFWWYGILIGTISDHARMNSLLQLWRGHLIGLSYHIAWKW